MRPRLGRFFLLLICSLPTSTSWRLWRSKPSIPPKRPQPRVGHYSRSVPGSSLLRSALPERWLLTIRGPLITCQSSRSPPSTPPPPATASAGRLLPQLPKANPYFLPPALLPPQPPFP